VRSTSTGSQVPDDPRDRDHCGRNAGPHVQLGRADDDESADDDDAEEAEGLRLAAERVPQRM